MKKILAIYIFGVWQVLMNSCFGQDHEANRIIMPTLYFTSPTENETANWSISSNALGNCSVVVFKPIRKIYQFNLDHEASKKLADLLSRNVVLNLKAYYGTPAPGGHEFSITWCFRDERYRVTLANIFRLKEKDIAPQTVAEMNSIKNTLIIYRSQILKAKIKELDVVAKDLDVMANELLQPERE